MMSSSKTTLKMKWKPFLKIFAKIKIPWILYILSFLSGLSLTWIALKLAPIQTKIQIGKFFEDNAIYVFVGLTIATILARMVQSGAELFGNEKVNRSLRFVLLNKILKTTMKVVNEKKQGGLVSRITNDAATASDATSIVTRIFASLYSFLGALVGMYSLNPTLTFTYALMIPLVFFIFWLIGRLQFNIQYKIFHTYGVMTDYFSEHLINMKHIKAQATEDEELNDGIEAIKTRYRADLYKTFMGGIQAVVGNLITTFSMIIIFAVGAYYVRNGTFKTSDLVTFNNLSMIMLPGLYELLSQFQTIKGAQGATANIANLMEAEEEQVKRKIAIGPSEEDIIFKNVAFGYNEHQILHDVSFTVPKGKVTAILGGNGAGKSTIFNLITRYYEPTAGSIMFGSQDVKDIHLDEWRRTMVYVSQSSPILSGTIRDNILYGARREVSEKELIRAATLANVYEFIQNCPSGFDTDVGEAGSRLSGGQKQRIAIARALILNPDYLLLDEATSNLDTKSERYINEALANLMDGKTIIKIAHNLQSVQGADNIVIIDNGHVVAEGTHNDLCEKNAYYKGFVDLHK
ncbi:ABC transporter ATP-binding protein [Niallia circulans]|uniref:ABC transporter ATP-binding protein n=2 Tax=Niallia circulans TaxID=1397 RepID=UPI0035244DAC